MAKPKTRRQQIAGMLRRVKSATRRKERAIGYLNGNRIGAKTRVTRRKANREPAGTPGGTPGEINEASDQPAESDTLGE